jgi:hypothetical protein
MYQHAMHTAVVPLTLTLHSSFSHKLLVCHSMADTGSFHKPVLFQLNNENQLHTQTATLLTSAPSFCHNNTADALHMHLHTCQQLCTC